MNHKYPPNEGWFACNIKDIKVYIKQMREQVAPKKLTSKRLKEAIDEDSFGDISIEECAELLKEE